MREKCTLNEPEVKRRGLYRILDQVALVFGGLFASNVKCAALAETSGQAYSHDQILVSNASKESVNELVAGMPPLPPLGEPPAPAFEEPACALPPLSLPPFMAPPLAFPPCVFPTPPAPAAAAPLAPPALFPAFCEPAAPLLPLAPPPAEPPALEADPPAALVPAELAAMPAAPLSAPPSPLLEHAAGRANAKRLHQRKSLRRISIMFFSPGCGAAYGYHSILQLSMRTSKLDASTGVVTSRVPR